MRLTARAADGAAAGALLDAEERAVRSVLAERLGDIVFGVDDETMEQAVADLLVARRLSLGVAESLTGGLIASRLVDVEGASRWFRGGIVAYDSAVKHAVLGVPAGPVVTEAAAAAMAEGARRVLGADVGLGITGVAGPDEQEGVAPGTVFVGLALPEGEVVSRAFRLPGDRPRVRQYSAISRPRPAPAGAPGPGAGLLNRVASPSLTLGTRVSAWGRASRSTGSTSRRAARRSIGAERHVALPPLQAAHVGAVHPQQVGEGLLAQALGPSLGPQTLSEPSLEVAFHDVHPAGQLLDSLQLDR